MGLRSDLKATLMRARAAEDREFVFGWGRLTVRVTQASSGFVILLIERNDTAPSDSDWDHIISQWPEPGPIGVTPTPRTEGKRHALIARWPRPASVTTTA